MKEKEKARSQRQAQFDEAMRSWAKSSPARLAAWLDPSVAGLPAQAFVLHSSELNDPELLARVIRPDLVIGVGSERVMHVEYETSPRATLTRRMYRYRDRLMDDFPDRRITQHVIVLRDGRVRGYDDATVHGFTLALKPVYLREHTADEFLGDPFLASFAALARGSPAEREEPFRMAIRLLQECGDPLSSVWLPAAMSFAEVRLKRSTIDRIEKESVMSVDAYVERFRDHRWGRALISEGREEGMVQGTERVLLETLRTRFGDSRDAREAARILSRWNDVAAAVRAVNAAGDPVSLLEQIRG